MLVRTSPILVVHAGDKGLKHASRMPMLGHDVSSYLLIRLDPSSALKNEDNEEKMTSTKPARNLAKSFSYFYSFVFIKKNMNT